jgi:hypothetical protein
MMMMMTTFVAASKMIKKAANMMTSEEKAAIVANVREIEKVYTKLKVTFAFNQEELMEIRHSIPYAANTNGGAEVRVKLCKELLMPMIQNMKPTSMELQTFGKLCQGAMNSAPLFEWEGVMITAGHLMAMRHLGAMPEGLYDMNVHAGRRLRELQTNYNFFQIKLAQKLYNDLRQRSGDLKPGKNLKTGEVVLMAEPTTPSHTWRLARVTETFPGKDGYVRVVEILDANKKEFLRSVRQLVKLPVAGAEEDKELSPTRAAMTKPPDNPPTNPSPANSQHPTAGPRRSPRLASSIMNTIMMFMMMLALTSASVTTIGNHGITFMEHRQVQINAGSYHAIMKTGLEPAKDSEKIQHFADHYLDACKNANKMDLGINCQISEA